MTPLAIEVETKARRLMADLRRLAELTEGLTEAEKEDVSARLQGELEATEQALMALFPGGL
jgi:hypothetical protein